MSKKNKIHKPQPDSSNIQNPVVENPVVEDRRVTPVEEGVNSIDETEVQDSRIFDKENTIEQPKEVVSSVADSQESNKEMKEDRSATTVENKKEKAPEIKKDVKKEAIVEKVEPVKDDKFYVSLGVIRDNKMEEVKNRLEKAGFNTFKKMNDEIVIGPFITVEECYEARKAIVRKGLKGRIVS